MASVISIRARENVLTPEATRAAYSAAEEAIASTPSSSRLLRARSGAPASGIGALATRRPSKAAEQLEVPAGRLLDVPVRAPALARKRLGVAGRVVVNLPRFH